MSIQAISLEGVTSPTEYKYSIMTVNPTISIGDNGQLSLRENVTKNYYNVKTDGQDIEIDTPCGATPSGMIEENENIKLYIPSNVKTRLEFFKGFGVSELIMSIIYGYFLSVL